MYCALMKVIMKGEVRDEQETKPRKAKEPWLTSWLGEDRRHRLILHRLVKVKLHQGVGPLPQCTAAGSEQRLAPLCTSSLPL
jgi:hypothetical protein